MDRVRAYIEANQERFLAELSAVLRFQSMV